MYDSLKSTVKLHNGVKMPNMGFGVWRIEDGPEVETAVKHAIDAGYRSIDTAAAYGNEDGVGNAIRDSDIPRDELFITSKVWNRNQGYDKTLRGFQSSMEKLKLDVLDLYLIHWPLEGTVKDTWRAMEELYEQGRIRAIGVCNFHKDHMEDLLQDARVTPMVNQVEFHPLLTQDDLRKYSKSKGIQFEAWSPLMQGNLDLPIINQLGEKYGKTPAQIVLRWDIQHGVVTIPKSVRQDRIVENADIFDFELSGDDMKAINDQNENRRFGPDPDNFEFGR